MITRFVYPKMDMFYKNRGMKEATQLLISSTTDDGKCWFGIREAIENYCEEYGCNIENVNWIIRVTPGLNGESATIRAKDIDDWVRQFKKLNVVFERIEERW